MKKYFSFLFFVLLFSYSANLFAQQSISSEAWVKYNAEKKSEFAAGGLEFLIPIVGHAYAHRRQLKEGKKYAVCLTYSKFV